MSLNIIITLYISGLKNFRNIEVLINMEVDTRKTYNSPDEMMVWFNPS